MYKQSLKQYKVYPSLVYYLEPSAKCPFRLVVISDLGFSCKLGVEHLHLLDILLYRTQYRQKIVTLIRSLEIGGESHESTMDLVQGLNRPRSATAYRFSKDQN